MLAVVLAVAAFPGCHMKSHNSGDPPPKLPEPTPVAVATIDAGAREHVYPAVPFAPDQAASPLLFAGSRLVSGGERGLKIWELPGLTSFDLSLTSLQALGAASDGALIYVDAVAAGLQLCRLAAGKTAPECWKTDIRAASSERPRLFPEPGSAMAIWVAPKSRSALRYGFAKGDATALESSVKLDENAYPTLTQLADGSFVYGRGGLARARPAEPEQSFVLADERAVFLTAPGPSADTAWISWGSRSGKGAELVQLAEGKLRTVHALVVPEGHDVHALAGHGAAVALLTVAPVTGGQWSPTWLLTVFDAAGKQLARLTPPWQATAIELPDYHLALGDGWVAVGGQAHLTVWELPSGKAHTLVP